MLLESAPRIVDDLEDSKTATKIAFSQAKQRDTIPKSAARNFVVTAKETTGTATSCLIISDLLPAQRIGVLF
jgi:hypothetical protein